MFKKRFNTINKLNSEYIAYFDVIIMNTFI